MISPISARPARVRPNATSVIWTLLAVAALVQAAVLVRYARQIPQTLRTAELDEAQIQRQLNGPLVAYAKQLAQELPAGSCLQFIDPDFEANRRIGRHYVFFNVYVLSHHLYPHAVRMVADAGEALAGTACGGTSGYALVWEETEPPRAAAAVAATARDLSTLQSSGSARLVSQYTDERFNRGYTFAITR